jgi:hypothetical protein
VPPVASEHQIECMMLGHDLHTPMTESQPNYKKSNQNWKKRLPKAPKFIKFNLYPL